MRPPVQWAGRVVLGNTHYNEKTVHVTVEARNPAAAAKRAVAEAGHRVQRGARVDRVSVTLTRIRVPALAACLGLLALGGCATSPSSQVAPALRADITLCRGDAREVLEGFGRVAFSDMAQRYAQHSFDRCMGERGWRRRGE